MRPRVLLLPLSAYAVYGGAAALYRHGDVCPGGLGVRTGSPSGPTWGMLPGADHPVVVIAEHPLWWLAGGRAKAGERLAVACLYEGGDPDLPFERWKNVKPGGVRAGTTDPDDLRRTFDSIPAEQWAALDAGLREVADTHQLGVYLLNEPAGSDGKRRPVRKSLS